MIFKQKIESLQPINYLNGLQLLFIVNLKVNSISPTLNSNSSKKTKEKILKKDQAKLMLLMPNNNNQSNLNISSIITLISSHLNNSYLFTLKLKNLKRQLKFIYNAMIWPKILLNYKNLYKKIPRLLFRKTNKH